MKAAVTVIKEHIHNLYLIRRLSLFELKTENNNAYLGVLWEVLNPVIQIGIYWFVFGLGIRRGREVDHVPFLIWMLAGMVVWFFVNQATMQATRAIHTRLPIISKMSFPMSVVPTFVIVKNLYQHLILLAIVSIIFEFTGFPVSIYMVQIPYFMFALLALIIAFTLLTSTLSTMVRDVQQLVQSLLRVLLYFTPLLWPSDHLPGLFRRVMMLNPLDYVVEGYRASLLGTSWYEMVHIKYTMYFWFVVVMLFVIGSSLHMKFRDRLVDYL
jgi:teichoic acid transport system permease protein